MTVYALGSQGPNVSRIQEALKAQQFYTGTVDGQFGGGTFAAVRAFQQAKGIAADGRVGRVSWAALFGQHVTIPASDMPSKPLALRCLALTGAFETGSGVPDCFCGLSGDFDGQGISFGVMHWNFGQESLQPLLMELLEDHLQVAQTIFGAHLDPLRVALAAPKDELMTFARSVQHAITHVVNEPWRGFAFALGRTPEFQSIQQRHASQAFDRALVMCADYAVSTERAAALMFDIVTQNGSIAKVTRAQIRAEAQHLPDSLADDEREVRTLEIVANRRAEAANPRWVDDVRRRKLCIARGEGNVHGISYDLDGQFGIGLRPL